jgi:hypothetical protein
MAEGTGNSLLGVTCSANSEMSSRTATITIRGTETTPGSASVTLIQAGYSPPGPVTLAVDPLTAAIEAPGGLLSFTVSTNGSWTVLLDQEWATPSSAGGTGSGTFTVVCAENTETSPRTATITVTATFNGTTTSTYVSIAQTDSESTAGCAGRNSGSGCGNDSKEMPVSPNVYYSPLTFMEHWLINLF